MSGASANILRYVHHLVEVNRKGSLSDHQLLERFAAQRDEAAFALLMRRHGPMVIGYARNLVKRGDERNRKTPPKPSNRSAIILSFSLPLP